MGTTPQIEAQCTYDSEDRVYRIGYKTTMLKAPKLSKKEAGTVASLIHPEEKFIAFATERGLHGGLLNPTIVLVTDHRTIIINRKYLRLKSDIAFIEHDSVASFRV